MLSNFTLYCQLVKHILTKMSTAVTNLLSKNYMIMAEIRSKGAEPVMKKSFMLVKGLIQ